MTLSRHTESDIYSSLSFNTFMKCLNFNSFVHRRIFNETDTQMHTQTDRQTDRQTDTDTQRTDCSYLLNWMPTEQGHNTTVTTQVRTATKLDHDLSMNWEQEVRFPTPGSIALCLIYFLPPLDMIAGVFLIQTSSSSSSSSSSSFSSSPSPSS